MDQMLDFEENLSLLLLKAREEYVTLSSQDLFAAKHDEREFYFARYSLLKHFISSVESLLDENRKVQRLGDALGIVQKRPL